MALYFDGSSAYRGSAQTLPGTNYYTVAAWMYNTTNLASSSGSTAFCNTKENVIWAQKYTNLWNTDGGAGDRAQWTPAQSVGAWTSVLPPADISALSMVLGLVDADEANVVQLWEDGSLTGTSGTNPTAISDQTTTCIGAVYKSVSSVPFPAGYGFYWYGYIESVGVYHESALNEPSAISSLAAGAHPYTRMRGDLRHYWPCRGTSVGTRTRDYVGGAHLTTVQGSPTAPAYPRKTREGWHCG